jgi:predicted AAA+ superfamily ATPase
MFIKREITPILIQFSQFFPVVALLGPRQSGKTTLVQEIFKEYHYINLENLDILTSALNDPRGFLERLLVHKGVILDEFQNAPDLLSYLQVIVDREKRPGFFILTGSQNFLMNQAIGQSLAGRVGILTLLPLSIREISDAHLQSNLGDVALFKGSYPRIFASNALAPNHIYPSYIQTYIERDVRTISNVTDLTLFKKFLGLCAGRVGQLLNVSALASDCGISIPTAQAWLSILQASYIIFLLQPHHSNFNKRLIKSSKLYFYDTGIACSLLGIDTVAQLENHYMRGALFENFIIADIAKQFFNHAKNPPLYFWRDSHGHEVDCIVEQGGKLLPIEIKASMTFHASFLDGIRYFQDLSGTTNGLLIYGGTEPLRSKDIVIESWKHFDVTKKD